MSLARQLAGFWSTERARTRLVAVAAIAFAAGVPSVFRPEYCLDDSYIHLDYVRSLKLGEGLSYNPHDWATGMTSPLWVLVLAAWPFGMPPVWFVKGLGVVLHAIGTALVLLVLQRSTPAIDARAQWLGALLWAGSPLAVHAAGSGMEVSLATSLVLGYVYCALRERERWAAGFAALATLARPELACFVALCAAGLSALRRRPGPALSLLATLAASGAYALYCQRVSGYPLPNTYYVKSRPIAWENLRYLIVEVLPQDSVVRSIVGIYLVGSGVAGCWRARRWPLSVVGTSALATLIAVAATRALYPGVDFAQSRYFVPLLWIWSVWCALGASALARRVALPLSAAVVVVAGLGLPQRLQLQIRQEHGIGRLHVEPAHYIRERVPNARVLGVEGAGALRYFTPRALRVIDVVGLNDRTLAHMRGDRLGRFCYLRDAGVTHFAYPLPWRARLSTAFELQTLASFTQPAYAQVDPAIDWTVVVAKVLATRTDFSRRCDAHAGTETSSRRP